MDARESSDPNRENRHFQELGSGRRLVCLREIAGDSGGEIEEVRQYPGQQCVSGSLTQGSCDHLYSEDAEVRCRKINMSSRPPIE